jgi:hypothetical protein
LDFTNFTNFSNFSNLSNFSTSPPTSTCGSSGYITASTPLLFSSPGVSNLSNLSNLSNPVLLWSLSPR